MPMISDEKRLSQAVPALVEWYAAHKISMPWREDPTPYHVWISEIMLQQTRVEAVLPYYNRFLTALPNIKALSIVSDGQLFTVKFNVSESAFADTAVSLSYSQEDTFDESFNDVILNCENITVSFDGGTIEPSEELKLSERIQKWAAELPSPWNTIMSILTAPVVFIISIFER